MAHCHYGKDGVMEQSAGLCSGLTALSELSIMGWHSALTSGHQSLHTPCSPVTYRAIDACTTRIMPNRLHCVLHGCLPFLNNVYPDGKKSHVPKLFYYIDQTDMRTHVDFKCSYSYLCITFCIVKFMQQNCPQYCKHMD